MIGEAPCSSFTNFLDQIYIVLKFLRGMHIHHVIEVFFFSFLIINYLFKINKKNKIKTIWTQIGSQKNEILDFLDIIIILRGVFNTSNILEIPKKRKT